MNIELDSSCIHADSATDVVESGQAGHSLPYYRLWIASIALGHALNCPCLYSVCSASSGFRPKRVRHWSVATVAMFVALANSDSGTWANDAVDCRENVDRVANMET